MSNRKNQHRGQGMVAGILIGALGGLIGLGGAEFRLPLLVGWFRLPTLEAVIFNKAMSLTVIVAALFFRFDVIPFSQVIAHLDIVLNLLAGSLLGAWFAADHALNMPHHRLRTHAIGAHRVATARQCHAMNE